MKRTLPCLGLALLVAGGTAWADKTTSPAKKSDRIFPYETHIEKLANGLQVVLVPMSSNGLVAYWTIVRTGARDEYEPGHTGFAHFFEHMMFRGTEKFPADVYSEITTKLGADDNAFTSDDLTAYHLSITSEDVEQVMELESDRFQNLAYPEAGFKTEAGAVYGEYRKNKSNPFFTISEAIHKAAFDKHTYGHTAMGYEEDIKAMPGMYDYSLTFFQRYYRPENVVLLVVGDIQIAPTMKLVHKYYDGWKPGYVAPQVPAEPEQTQEKRIEVPYEGKSLPILWVAYKGPAFDPKDRTMVGGTLMMELAFGETSDIHKKLVLDEQVVEFIEGEVNTNRDPGLIDVVTRVKDPDRVDYVLGEIDAVVAQYQKTPPDAQRLADLKSRLKYGFLMGLETPSAVAGGLARMIAVTGGVDAVDTLYRTYDTITPQDVQTAAKQYLVRTRRTVAVLRGGES